MKYFLKIILTIILAVATVFGVYYYFNGKLPVNLNSTTHHNVTVSKAPASELYASRTTLAKLKNQKITLYKSGKTIILKHKKKEFVFENWTSMVNSPSAPVIYYHDFDGDGVDEIIISCEVGQDEDDGEKLYDLYVLNPIDKEESNFNVLLISQETWHSVLDSSVAEELTQLKSNKKFLQFAMATKRTDINYDPDSGLLLEAPSAAFARAMQDENGAYLTLNSWALTKGVFKIDDDYNINVDVEVLVYYSDANVKQDLGSVHFGLDITEKNTFTISKKSMYFAPDKAYRIADPRAQAQTNWEFKRNNSAAAKEPHAIQWLKYAFALDSTVIEDTQDLGSEETDIKYVKSLVLRKDSLVITAADGCTFSADAAGSGDFSVTINKGTVNEYEISYTASLNELSNELIILFDKSYDETEITSVDVSYGSK